MSKQTFSEINGKSLMAHSFWIKRSNDGLMVEMECTVEKTELSYLVIFENASRIALNGISAPFQICDLEIVDHGPLGYDDASRFLVKDPENGALSLYCESIQILSVEKTG